MGSVRTSIIGRPRPSPAHPRPAGSYTRQLVGTGLRDAAVVAGQGWRMTYGPVPWLPAVIRIDHVLVSPTVGVHRYGVGRVAGDGHRSLQAVLVLPASR